MNSYTYKILELFVKNSVITKAKYVLSATDDQNTVSLMDWASIVQPADAPTLDEITEKMVAKWVDTALTVDNINATKEKLNAQLAEINGVQIVVPAWLFKVPKQG
jgi:hypothetical protein